MAGEVLNTLNNRFRNCCRVLLGEEAGDVWEFDSWLGGLTDPNRKEKSHISGKGVELGIKEYAENARFVSFDEIDFLKRLPKVDLGQVKGLDSLVALHRDRFAYCGNVVIGNCGHVEKSTNISDSFFVYDSALYGDSKYLYKCTVGRESSDLFGVHAPGETKMCIRCTQTYQLTRCFEAWMCQECMDCYYSINLQNCNECIFCFNMKNAKYCVGNRQLPPEKYKEVKARLLSEMAGVLKREKKLPSLMDIVEKSAGKLPEIPPQKEVDLSGGRDAVEGAFSKTSKLVLGTELSGLDSYKGWLLRNTHTMDEVHSASSGKRIPFIAYVLALPPFPDNRILSYSEAMWLGKNASISTEEAEGLTLANAHEKIGGIAFFHVEIFGGKCSNLTDCSIMIDDSYCYLTSAMVYSKYCACGMWPRSSEHVFGFDTLWDCSFCIKCYHSVKLSRCFEVDGSHNCTDCYFCHNIENCHECMFCFNAKSLRYAIGNAEYPKEEYLKIKKLLLSDIGSKLLKDKKLDFSVYNIGGKQDKTGG